MDLFEFERKVYLSLKKLFWNIFVNRIAASIILPQRIRIYIYKIFGCKIKDSGIYSGQFFTSSDVEIGRNTFINHNCFFENTLAKIEIEENCSIAMEVMFCTATHESGNKKKRAGTPIGKPILVKKGSWIGTRVVIMPGVIIGEGCIIAAGSLVNKNCEPNSLYAGIPARKVKILD